MTDSRPDGPPAADSHGERSDEETSQAGHEPPSQAEFDWRGWVLVAVIVTSLLVVPGAILYLPHAQEAIARLGISWRQAYLVLPMIPALLLGGVAIWAAVTSRRVSE